MATDRCWCFTNDGTFTYVETQGTGLFPLGYGQERGCYTTSGSTITMTTDAACRPDDFAAYDLNLGGGIVNWNAGVPTKSFPFTINDADTITFSGFVCVTGQNQIKRSCVQATPVTRIRLSATPAQSP